MCGNSLYCRMTAFSTEAKQYNGRLRGGFVVEVDLDEVPSKLRAPSPPLKLTAGPNLSAGHNAKPTNDVGQPD